MKHAAFVVLLGAVLSSACAHGAKATRGGNGTNGACYAAHELASILKRTNDVEGKPGYIDLKYLDQVLADLMAVLNTYPPAFASPDDQERAVRDVRGFSAVLEPMLEPAKPPVELLWRVGLLNAMGHQLDLPEAPQKAVKYFTQALAINPEHPAANYHFGTFLWGAGRGREGLPHLLKAQSLGVDDADYSLGMAYLVIDDLPRATACFRTYSGRHPDHQGAARLLKALESGAPITRQKMN